MRAIVITIIAFAATVPVLSRADCSASSKPEGPHLVELYTSEGCDSCPPAERWMSGLRDKTDLIGLEFHVDYWDSSSWRDPYSDHAYTTRQQTLAKRGNKDVIYTPQIWLDGKIWQNWPKGAPPSPFDGPSPTLRMTVETGDEAKLHIDATVADPASYRIFAALTQNGLSSDVRGGENHGKRLGHDQVVRVFSGPLPLPHADTSLKFPANTNMAQSSVVAFVQDERDGSVVQVLRLPLKECAR